MDQVCPACQRSDAQSDKLMETITAALMAMDDGRYGDARSILRSGRTTTLKTTSQVLTLRPAQ